MQLAGRSVTQAIFGSALRRISFSCWAPSPLRWLSSRNDLSVGCVSPDRAAVDGEGARRAAPGDSGRRLRHRVGPRRDDERPGQRDEAQSTVRNRRALRSGERAVVGGVAALRRGAKPGALSLTHRLRRRAVSDLDAPALVTARLDGRRVRLGAQEQLLIDDGARSGADRDRLTFRDRPLEQPRRAFRGRARLADTNLRRRRLRIDLRELATGCVRRARLYCE